MSKNTYFERKKDELGPRLEYIDCSCGSRSYSQREHNEHKSKKQHMEHIYKQLNISKDNIYDYKLGTYDNRLHK